MKFSAVILAGGKSSRMGRDKAFLEMDGQTLLARQIETVCAAGATEVFLSGRAEVDYSASGLPVLLDRFSDAGPLAGIHAALAAARQPLLLVLAVDLPAMNAMFLRSLTLASVAGGGVIPRVAGQMEPLAALYPCSALATIEQLLLQNNFSVRQFAEACVTAGLARFEEVPADVASLFKNVNSSADLPCLT